MANRKTYSQQDVDLVRMSNKIDNIEKVALENRDLLRKNYVTKEELALTNKDVELLKKIVYGVVALILTAVVGAVVSLVVKQ